ncbi:rhodanese-like domain-containing protein [Kitasatospora sp. MMS16-BH015]|uniref:sulfurtransferase n=1 Tax=Kitasatospora sp. MMS16-BH015 TaxID=2018025 RepID=UPI000CA1B849|nr:sulfurtransferase [Kitasatospora sp. MMS16-BH015]AUG78976.1 rhodanese-like domain-containing protein [Kitasatospora sp. MMS16-BH015]
MNRDNILVSTDWVKEHGQDEGIVLIEITDGGPSASGRIPGAVSLDWTRDLQDPVRRDLITPEEFAALAGRHGIGPEDTLVFYSGNSNWWAAAGFWQFRMAGHRELRLLDGGLARWEALGLPLTFETPRRARTEYPVRTPDRSPRAYRDDLLSGIGELNLVDVRSLEEYLGDRTAPPGVPDDLGVRPGHVLSAQHLPWNAAVNPDGTFRSDAELKEVYGCLDTSVETVVYCRVGWRSAHSWFVLHELLGFDKVSNYDGAWREFGSLIGSPVVKGPLPWGAVRTTENSNV